MARIAPQAPVHHLATVGGVGPEASQLLVPHGLEPEPDPPDPESEHIEQTQRAGTGGDLRHDQRRTEDPHQRALQEEHLGEADPPPGRPPLFPPAGVAEILGLPPVPAQDVQREPQAPPSR